MRRLTTFLMTLLLSLVVSNAFAQAESDITSETLTNPSFEADAPTGDFTDGTRDAYAMTALTGWTVTGEPAVLDLMTEDAKATDNDFGKPGEAADGTYMLYVRNSWETKTVSVLQDVTLPAGSYKLTVDTKCVTKSSTAKLVAGSEEVALTLNSAMPEEWDSNSLTFTVGAETEVSLGVVISFEGADGSFLIDNFKLYQVMPVDDGDYLVVNVESGNYLAGGLWWGTCAMEGGKPQFFTFELQDGGTYTLDSHQYESTTKHYLGTGLYVDEVAANWVIAEVDGGYTLYNATAGGYLTGNGFQKALTGEATAGATAVWTLVTKDEILASMADATEDNPVDVSALIPACEPKRNPWGGYGTSGDVSWIATGYNVSAVPGNYAFGSGSNVASVTESYHSNNGFDIRQTVPTLPAGKYTLTAQAFYRIDTANSDTPVMYAGDMTNCVELPSFAGDATGVPNSMVTAYSAFLDGDYPVSLDFTVANDDTNVTVGFTSGAASSGQWTIFGELGLLYLGEVETEPYEFVCTDWGSMDTGRVADANVTYNEADNTITVVASGTNNVALSNGRDPYTTANMYVTNEQCWYTVVGTNLSTTASDSKLWWMNGLNSGEFDADVVVTLSDGQVLVAWDLSTKDDINGNLQDKENLLTGWTGFGLTSTTGTSVISDINFYTEDELDDMTKGELVYVTVYSCEAEPVSAEDNTPAHWTASPALDNAYFHINTWSSEGASDGSGMLTPFVEYWVGKGNGLADVFISHNAISGLEAGTYKVSIDARAYDEGSLAEAGQGITFNVNGTDVALSDGTQGVYNDESALVYGTYTIEDIESTDGNLSIRFVVASQENCDWLSWKNLKVEQRVNTRDIILTPAEGMMNADIADAQDDAVETFYETRTADDYYAAVEAIEAAEASVAFYAELTALIEKYADKLDETGAAFWEQTQGYIGYEGDGVNGYLTEDDIDLFMASLIAAQSVQTTDNTDWSLVMKYTGTWEAPYSNSGTFGIYADGVESYAGTNYTAEEGQILYKTVEDLLPGTYEVTFYAAANSCHLGDAGISGDDIAQVFANDAVVDVTVGTLSAISDMSVYEVTLTAIVGEDGVLVFGIQNIATGGNWYVAQEVSLQLVDFATETVEDDDYAIDDEVVIGDDTYKILSENLFVNGGFNEKASYGIVPGWTAGNTYTDPLLAENVIIETEGGYNGGGFLTLPESVGAASEHTPTQAIKVTPGSTYLFVGYTSGTEPTDANKRYSALFAMQSATEEAHIVEGETTYGEDIITLEWGDGDEELNGWTKTIGAFVATTDYVGMRMNWSKGSYDGLQLYEVESPQVVPGDYLVMVDGNYLAGGLNWGTKGMEGGKPQFIGFEQTDNGLYTLDSYQSNGGDSHYLGVVVSEEGEEEVYFDTAGATWMVLKNDDGTINIGNVAIDEKTGEPDMTVAIGWLKTRGFQNAVELVAGRANATNWTLVKKSDILASMEEATADAPVDVTALIPAAEPKRNAWGDAWTMTAYDGESTIANGALGQGINVASVAESWHSENGFLFTQIIPDLPVGTYELTAQAFYRNDIDVDDPIDLVVPVMYAGDEVAELSELPTELTEEEIAAGITIPNDMVNAYQAFLLEEYPVSVMFYVGEEGDVEIGFSSELATDNQLWTIFGELGLQYYGEEDLLAEPEPEPEPEPTGLAGDYLIVDAEGNYLGGGLTWGTQAAIIGKPQFIGFEMLEDGAYTLDSHQYNNATAHYLGTNLYFDSTPVEWTITEVEGGYTIYGTVDDGTGYLTSNGFQTVPTVEETPYVWTLVTKDDVIATMADATEEAPVDVTALIASPELKRNSNTTYYPTWTVTGFDGTGTPSNYAFGGGSAVANCAESFHSTNGFNFSQEITLPLAGTYTLSAQGFYRNDYTDGTTPVLPVMYVDDQSVEFPEITRTDEYLGVDDNMANAYQEFLLGLHPIDAITITTEEDGETVTIGFAGEDTSLWQIMGELTLLYLGNGEVVEPGMEPGTVVHECVAEIDHWSIAGNSAGLFQYNYWSTETDESGMVTPFIEYWIGSGSILPDATISHETLTDLPAGAYEVSIFARAFNERSTTEVSEGITFTANGVGVDLTTGTKGMYEFVETGITYQSAEVYGTYTVICEVGEDGTLEIGFDVAGLTACDWVAFKNLTVTYIGEEIPADNSYQFVCTDWVALDPVWRVTDDNITYDEVANTITVEATGDNNVALGNSLSYGTDGPFTTAEYTVSNAQNLFIVVASDIVVDAGASYLWWMNGANDVGSYEPTYVVECDDESGYILVWDLTTTGIDTNLQEDENYLNGWTGFGLTSTNGSSTISDISFYTPDAAVAKYPELGNVIATEIAGVGTEKVAEGIYTLSGVRISKITKSGIYIVDGKKVLVK